MTLNLSMESVSETTRPGSQGESDDVEPDMLSQPISVVTTLTKQLAAVNEGLER